MTTMQERTTDHTGVLHQMDSSGDSRFMWDVEKPDEVAGAQAQFDALKKKGYLAYSVDENGEKGQVIREFDPTAAAIIMTPQLVGG